MCSCLNKAAMGCGRSLARTVCAAGGGRPIRSNLCSAVRPLEKGYMNYGFKIRRGKGIPLHSKIYAKSESIF